MKLVVFVVLLFAMILVTAVETKDVQKTEMLGFSEFL